MEAGGRSRGQVRVERHKEAVDRALHGQVRHINEIDASGGIEEVLDFVNSLDRVLLTDVNQGAGVLKREHQVTYQVRTGSRRDCAKTGAGVGRSQADKLTAHESDHFPH